MLKYLLVGFICNLIEITGLYILTEFFNLLYIYSNIVIGFTALMISYLLNNFWTFGNKQISKSRIFVLISVHFFNLGISTLLIYVFASLLHIYYMLAKILTNSICVIWNYLISKFIIYK